MGGSCSHAADVWANLATKEELRDAVNSIEAWQKAQEQSRATGGGAHRNANTGPLLQRVGGLDVVKQVVEGFYKRLYSDPKLLVYLHDKDMVYLRAKQTLFMSWLFGPPNQPYTGRNVRIAHLRLIKQRGFAPEDFDLGMTYFEEAMRELEAPESIISEVMSKVRPFKTAIFTPCDKDAEEEARWAFEERLKEQQAADKEKRLQSTRSDSQSSKGATLKGQSNRSLGTAASGGGATAAAAASGVGSGSINISSPRGPTCPFTGLGGGGGGSGSGSGRQCPFTSGRLSRPTSAEVAASGSSRVSGKAVTPVPPAAASSGSSKNIVLPSPPQQSLSSRVGTASSSPKAVAAPAATCADGSEAPAAPACAEFPAAVAAAAAAAYAGSANGSCEDHGAVARELKPQDSKSGCSRRSSTTTPQPQTPDAGSRPVSAAAPPPPSQLQPQAPHCGPLAVSRRHTPEPETPRPPAPPAAAAAPAAPSPVQQQQQLLPSRSGSRPASAAVVPPPSPPPLVPSSSGPQLALAAAPPSLRPVPSAAAALPPPPQPVSRPPSVATMPTPSSPKPGSRPPSAIPQPPPKKPASRPASSIPGPPAASALTLRAGSRPGSVAPDGPFSVASGLAGLARSATQNGGGAAVGAAGLSVAAAGKSGEQQQLQRHGISSIGPCAESAEIERFWEAELNAAAQLPAAVAAAPPPSAPGSRSGSRQGGGKGKTAERPALVALEMAVEMGLAEPEEGDSSKAAAAAERDDAGAAAGAGGVELVDAFLTEMLAKEAEAANDKGAGEEEKPAASD